MDGKINCSISVGHINFLEPTFFETHATSLGLN